MKINVELPLPHSGQRRVIESKARWKILICGRRWGKTLVALIISIQAMLKGEKVAYITPEFSLGKEFFKELQLLLPVTLIKVDNKSELYIELITGGSLKFFSGEAINSMRGRKYHKVIIDEAAYVSDLESAWNNSVRPTLTDYNGTALFISTPKGKNFFHSLYLRGKNNEENYESFHYTSYDNPFIDNSEIDEAKSTLPEIAFNQEYLAIASDNMSNPFGGYIDNNIIKSLSSKIAVVYSIDVAKYNDWTVEIGVDSDGVVCHYKRYREDWTTTMYNIRKLPDNIPKIIDASGVGDVITEQLQNTTRNIIGFKFTGESKPKIIFELIKDVELGAIKYPQPIADEMHVYQYIRTPTGHLKFEAQSGYNDDGISALAMANHHRKFYNINNWQFYSA